jgi:hypothetical protein
MSFKNYIITLSAGIVSTYAAGVWSADMVREIGSSTLQRLDSLATAVRCTALGALSASTAHLTYATLRFAGRAAPFENALVAVGTATAIGVIAARDWHSLLVDRGIPLFNPETQYARENPEMLASFMGAAVGCCAGVAALGARGAARLLHWKTPSLGVTAVLGSLVTRFLCYSS